MGLAVERLPLTLHWKKLYISGRSNDNDNLLGIDYGGSHIVALQRSSERRKTKQGEERCQPLPLLIDEQTTASQRLVCDKKRSKLVQKNGMTGTPHPEKQKAPDRVKRSEAICFKSYPQHM